MTSYLATTNIDHDGKRYVDGDPISIDDDKQAERLRLAGAIDAAPATTPASGSKKPAKEG